MAMMMIKITIKISNHNKVDNDNGNFKKTEKQEMKKIQDKILHELLFTLPNKNIFQNLYV